MGYMATLQSDVVLFDLDGVLVDSRAAIARCINHALREQGLPAQPAADLHRFIGPPLGVAFSELAGQPIDSPLTIALMQGYRDIYAAVSLSDTTVAPGVENAVASLARTHRLGVATSKPHAFAEPLLAALGLRKFFQTVSGPDLSAHSEDKAATIRQALDALGTHEAVMVGDRSYDVLGARACSIPAIGVTWGIGGREELTSSGADRVIDTPSELAGTVAELTGSPGARPS
jgi:phosphoglycolate phosphatase